MSWNMTGTMSTTILDIFWAALFCFYLRASRELIEPKIWPLCSLEATAISLLFELWYLEHNPIQFVITNVSLLWGGGVLIKATARILRFEPKCSILNADLYTKLKLLKISIRCVNLKTWAQRRMFKNINNTFRKCQGLVASFGCFCILERLPLGLTFWNEESK